MTKKQKKTLKRIIAAAVLTVLLALLFHFVELPWFVQLVLWLVPYLVIGHDVLRKAFMGIKNGEVFDENFLMAVATVGAIGCGEYAEGEGTIVYVARDGQFLGSILISDEEKPTAGTAMQGLQAQGVRTVMLTGDAPAVAELVAKDLGIDEVHAGLLPADKVAWVEKLLAQKPEKKELAFVGDGINDAPVLMRADIGIAMGALGSDAAIEAADIVLMDDDPAKISLAMRISRKCMRIVYQNIVFALAVKALCLILSALGITNMWWGVFADVGVMVLAVLNATRMLNVKEYQ